MGEARHGESWGCGASKVKWWDDMLQAGRVWWKENGGNVKKYTCKTVMEDVSWNAEYREADS